MRRERHMVLFAEHVGKTEVDELDFVGADQIKDFIGGHGKSSGLSGSAQSNTGANESKSIKSIN